MKFPIMRCTEFDKGVLQIPCWVQPKLNGIFCIWSGDTYYTRTGKPITCMCPPYSVSIPLVGELYRHGWSLQRIRGAVKRDEASEDTMEIKFHCFDAITLDWQEKRFNIIKQLCPEDFIDTRIITDKEQVNSIYRYYLVLGYEGAVYRNRENYYVDGRSKDLLKRKPWPSDEYECVAVTESAKVPGALGAFVLKVGNKTFHCGGGDMTWSDRVRFLRNPPIGKLIRIRYAHLSPMGIPQQPQFEAIRDYE